MKQFILKDRQRMLRSAARRRAMHSAAAVGSYAEGGVACCPTGGRTDGGQEDRRVVSFPQHRQGLLRPRRQHLPRPRAGVLAWLPLVRLCLECARLPSRENVTQYCRESCTRTRRIARTTEKSVVRAMQCVQHNPL